MFYGTFNHAIDAKGRTSLPAKFREALVAAGEPKVFLAPSPVWKALVLRPLSEWKRLEERVMQASPFDKKAQRTIQRFVSTAHDLDLDDHGRILVPPNLRSFAGLVKDVTWSGNGRDILLWDRATYEAEMNAEMGPDDVKDFFA